MYFQYLKQHGIPWVLIVYPLVKSMQVYYNGFEVEFNFLLLFKELIVWSLAALLYSYSLYYWYYIRLNNNKK